jgi:hemolysin III
MFRDPVSAASHWLMAFLSVFVGIYLIRLTCNNPKRCVFISVFVVCSTLVYSASGLFHTIEMNEARFQIFQKIDMSAIYLMIAGSCTLIIGILMRGLFRSVLLILQWTFAVSGIALLWILAKPIYPLMVALYLGMGLVGCLGCWHFWKATGWQGIAWALGGTFWYILGAVTELVDWPVLWPGVVGSHEVFHLLVMLGTVFHVVFIIKYVIPYPDRNVDAELVPSRRVALSG